MGKIEKIKKIFKKIKSGVQSIKKLSGDIKKMIEEFKMKITIKVLVKYVILPMVAIAVIIGLFFYIFQALWNAFLSFLSGVAVGIKFIFVGRSATVDTDLINKTRYELESKAVNFDDIGYLGKEFEKDGIEAKANVDGYSAGDLLDSVEDLVEYKGALEKAIKEKTDSKAWISEITLSEDSTKATNTLKEYAGKVVMIKEKDGEGYSYYTATIDSAGGKSKLSDYDDYYKALQVLKSDAISFYLRKYLEAESYCFHNYNAWTFDSKDRGAITVNFANDEEEKQCNDVGLFQKLFEGATDSFSVYQSGKSFFAKIGPIDKGKNIDITNHVYDFAMPHEYPLAFHQSTLAPDIGYKVAELVTDDMHHELELELFVVGKELEFKYESGYSDSDVEGSTLSGKDIVGANDYTIVPTVKKQKTWYREETFDYEEKRVGSPVEVGSVYDVEGLLSDWNTKSMFYGKSYSDYLDSLSLDDREKITEIEIGNVLKYKIGEKIATVYTYDHELVEKDHDVSLNDDGIDDMDKIVKSIPTYKYENGQEQISNPTDLKYYYTANNYIENSHNGKTILSISTNAQSIVDGVYDIYNENDAEVKELESKYAKDASSLTVSEYNEATKSSNNYKRDYKSANKVVKDLICYFYEMGVLNSEEFAEVYNESSIYSAALGYYAIWPLMEEAGNVSSWSYDASTSVGKINCPAGKVVVAPISGEIESVKDPDNDGVGDIVIAKKVIVTNPDGSTTTTSEKVILGDVKIDSTISVGNSVNSGDRIGMTVGPITYQHILPDGTASITEKDLTGMYASANSEYKWPIRTMSTYISSKYGMRTHPITGEYKLHTGIDITGAGIEGQPIYPIARGQVIYNGYSESYGNHVIIYHGVDASGQNIYSLYGHMLNKSPIPVSDEIIDANTSIGKVGSTGYSSGPHLHLEIRVGKNQYGEPYCRDPLKYLTNTGTDGKSTDADSTDVPETTVPSNGTMKIRFTGYIPESSSNQVGSGHKTSEFSKDPTIGCYTYNGKLVLAGANELLLVEHYSKGWDRRGHVKYFDYYDEVKFNFKGKQFTGIILDSCGVSMAPEKYYSGANAKVNVLDVFFPTMNDLTNSGLNQQILDVSY